MLGWQLTQWWQILQCIIPRWDFPRALTLGVHTRSSRCFFCSMENEALSPGDKIIGIALIVRGQDVKITEK